MNCFKYIQRFLQHNNSITRRMIAGLWLLVWMPISVAANFALVAGNITPAATSIYSGQTVAFTSVAPSGGNCLPSDQFAKWQQSPNNSTWTDIAGAYSVSGYTTGALSTGTYYFRKVVTCGSETAYSNVATVTVNPPPVTSGTVSPATQTINYGDVPKSLETSAPTGGNGTFTYQWQSSPNNSTWTNVPNATAKTFTPAALTATTYFRLVTTSNAYSVNSNAVVVNVYPDVLPGTIGTAQTINANTTPVAFTATAPSGGNGTYTYVWQTLNTSNGSWGNIPNATGATYAPGVLTTTTHYRRVVYSNGADAYSNNLTITVQPALTAGAISPAAQAINHNKVPAAFTGTAPTGGSGTYTYVWQSSSNNSTWTNIPNATSATYQAPALTATTYYRRVASSNNSSANSNVATVTVYPPVSATVTPATQSVNYYVVPGILTANPTGGNGTYTYVWQSSPNNSTWTNIPNATAKTYTPVPLTATTYFRALVTSNGVQVITGVATVTVVQYLDGGAITSSNQTIPANTIPTTINATPALGGNCNGVYTYQWEASTNNSTYTDISGATAQNLTLSAAITDTTWYRRKVTCGTDVKYTDVVQVAVKSGGSGTLFASQVIAPGATPKALNVLGGSGCTLLVQWSKSTDEVNWTIVMNFSDIGNTGPEYQPPATSTTTYYRAKLRCTNLREYYTNSICIRVKPAAGTIVPDNSITTTTQTVVAMPAYPNNTNTGTMNSIRARVISKPGVLDLTSANALTDKFDVTQTTKYFDGLGRIIQTVTRQSTPEGKDWITTQWYDVLGREQQKYLPYTDGGATGEFRMDAAAKQKAFYDNHFANQEGFYYSNVQYEASPLKRVFKETAPGKSWAGVGTGKRTITRTNQTLEEIRRWTIAAAAGSIPQVAGVYSPGELSITETTDEHENKTIEYKNRHGLVVLKKVQISDQLQEGHTGWYCTYFVYDALNNLRIVMQPEAVEQVIIANWQLSAAVMNELCFRYEYDSRRRLIIKKVPGSAEVWMVYDFLDRLVMQQDGNLRAQATKQWLVTEYDKLNRIIRTGLWTNSSDRATHANAAVLSTNYPAPTSGYEVLTENYYDDYSYTGAKDYDDSFAGQYQAGANLYPETQTLTNQVRSLMTGQKVKVLGTASQYLITTFYYDEDGRVLQTLADNITGGVDIVTNQYNFNGSLRNSYVSHQKKTDSAEMHTLLTKMEYDHGGRVKAIRKSIDGAAEKLTVQNTWNDLGQSKKKQLGQKTGGFVETLDYVHNIRGWMQGINRGYANPAWTEEASAQSGRWFGMELLYDQGVSRKQYNANIAGVRWKSTGDDEQRFFGYEYDNTNRLLKADFTQYTSNAWNTSAGLNFSVKMGDGADPVSAYDANGNIRRMQQWGYKGTASIQMDDMVYDYFPNSNKLRAVREKSAGAVAHQLGDFTDRYQGGVDFGYDQNGNMVTDMNKRINGSTGVDLAAGGAITYNHLNLPQLVKVAHDNGTAKGTIQFTYDAAGNKLRKTVTEGTAKTVTTYLSEFVYQHRSATGAGAPDTLQLITHEEGRIRKATNGTFVYDYFVKDQLNNVRMVLTEESVQDIYPAATLEGDINNFGTAAGVEKMFYKIDAARIANQSEATGIPAYQSNNGIANPYPSGNSGNTTQGQNSQKLYALQAAAATNGGVTGLGITLKVMAGDKLDVFGKSYYFQQNTAGTNYTVPFSAILEGLLSAPTGAAAGKGVTAPQLGAIPGITGLISNYLSDPGRNNNGTATTPKAYINWMLLDEQFKYVSGNFSRVGTANTLKNHYGDAQMQNIAVQKNGYLYVYVSNESPVKVYFDNLQVVHTRGPLLEETHYYPFGLTMAAISSRGFGRIPNKYKFGGKELQSNEFSDNWSLELYDFSARNYDPQIGRWHSNDPKADKLPGVTPYNYCLNDPIKFFDPDGEFPYPIHIRSFAPFKHFGGGFGGDGEKRGYTTSLSATARVQQTFTVDPTAGTQKGLRTWSDPSHHAVFGTKTEQPTGSITNFTSSKDANGNATVSFTATMAGANPLVPASPDIDVSTTFTMTENVKAGTLDITANQVGDRFPAAETFITDTKGNSLFVGVSPYDGNPYTSLPGENKREMMSSSFTVTIDKNGVFTGVKNGKNTYTIAEWNKMMQGQAMDKNEKHTFNFGGGSGGGSGAIGAW